MILGMNKKFWLHVGITVLVALIGATTPAVKEFATVHPTWGGLIVTVWTIVGAAIHPREAQ